MFFKSFVVALTLQSCMPLYSGFPSMLQMCIFFWEFSLGLLEKTYSGTLRALFRYFNEIYVPVIQKNSVKYSQFQTKVGMQNKL